MSCVRWLNGSIAVDAVAQPWEPSQGERSRAGGVEHRERRHVDAADGETDGVVPQVVGERFDLG